MADTPHPAPATDPHLAAYLAERDEPCPACTYNLRGLKTDRCPECNRELVLQIRLAEPRLGAWITCLSAAAAMLGFNGLLLLYFFFWAMRRPYPPDWSLVIPLALSVPVAAAMLFLTVTRRRQFGNLSSPARATLATLAWLVTIASAMAFFGTAK
jgi:hypothetical protein